LLVEALLSPKDGRILRNDILDETNAGPSHGKTMEVVVQSLSQAQGQPRKRTGRVDNVLVTVWKIWCGKGRRSIPCIGFGTEILVWGMERAQLP
jgi:hypothetical protein